MGGEGDEDVGDDEDNGDGEDDDDQKDDEDDEARSVGSASPGLTWIDGVDFI